MNNLVKNSIEVSGLHKSFRMGKQKVDVLKGLNFSVAKGEFLSIMGPSGCGKSTLLYLLGGLDKPTQGNISIDGKDLALMNEKEKSVMRRRKIGFVFQFYNLVSNLTVEDNILLPLLIDGKKVRHLKNDLDKILNLIEMTDRRKHTPVELSGGQQQRVAIARALLFGPEIIFADEPTGNLDSKSGTEILKLFRNINIEYKKTIIQVTHSDDAAGYGTSIIRMKDGVIESKQEVN